MYMQPPDQPALSVTLVERDSLKSRSLWSSSNPVSCWSDIFRDWNIGKPFEKILHSQERSLRNSNTENRKRHDYGFPSQKFVTAALLFLLPSRLWKLSKGPATGSSSVDVFSSLPSSVITIQDALRLARFTGAPIGVPSSLMVWFRSTSPMVLNFLSISTESTSLISLGTSWRTCTISLKCTLSGRGITAVKEKKIWDSVSVTTNLWITEENYDTYVWLTIDWRILWGIEYRTILSWNSWAWSKRPSPLDSS